MYHLKNLTNNKNKTKKKPTSYALLKKGAQAVQ